MACSQRPWILWCFQCSLHWNMPMNPPVNLDWRTAALTWRCCWCRSCCRTSATVLVSIYPLWAHVPPGWKHRTTVFLLYIKNCLSFMQCSSEELQLDIDSLFTLVCSDPEFEGLLPNLSHSAVVQAVREAINVLYTAPAHQVCYVVCTSKTMSVWTLYSAYPTCLKCLLSVESLEYILTLVSHHITINRQLHDKKHHSLYWWYRRTLYCKISVFASQQKHFALAISNDNLVPCTCKHLLSTHLMNCAVAEKHQCQGIFCWLPYCHVRSKMWWLLYWR